MRENEQRAGLDKEHDTMCFFQRLRAAVVFCGLSLLGGVSCGADAGGACPVAPAPVSDCTSARNGPGDGYWVVTLSPYTYHWSYDARHAHVVLVALERHHTDETLAGISVFRNSFGQPSAYGYYGWQWNHLWARRPEIYAKLSLGVIYGYLPPYEDKVPLNYHGFSLGIIPAIGYRLSPTDALQINVLGNAGLTFSYERSF